MMAERCGRSLVHAAPAQLASSHWLHAGGAPRIQRFSESPKAGRWPPARVQQALARPGQALEPAVRQEMTGRFGHDFSQVRVHADADAAHSARALDAQAYTVGRDIVFGAGRFAPETREGRRLLAHELTHVVQQHQAGGQALQRSRLSDFNDKDPRRDPSKLTDTEIEATNEFKAYMDSKLAWQWRHHMTQEEARLACRLMLRRMREGETVNWERAAGEFMLRARAQLGTLKGTEGLVGKLEWTQASWSAFDDPATSGNAFAKWLLAGASEPTTLGKMNCWEMILFGGFRAGVVDKAKLQSLYRAAQAKARSSSDAKAPAIEIENRLCGGETTTVFDPKDPRSPAPLPGDIIIFDVIENHAAIARGTKTTAGEHRVLSLDAGPTDPNHQVEETTLEKLLARTKTVARLCRAPWRAGSP